MDTSVLATTQRFLGLDVGRYRLALPLLAVRQILELGGRASVLPQQVLPEGTVEISMAELFGEPEASTPPGRLLMDGGEGGAIVLAVHGLGEVFAAAPPVPLPSSLVLSWPGLFLGVVSSDSPRLVLSPPVFLGLLVEAVPRGA